MKCIKLFKKYGFGDTSIYIFYKMILLYTVSYFQPKAHKLQKTLDALGERVKRNNYCRSILLELYLLAG